MSRKSRSVTTILIDPVEDQILAHSKRAHICFNIHSDIIYHLEISYPLSYNDYTEIL